MAQTLTQVTCIRCEKQFPFDPTEFQSYCHIHSEDYCYKHKATYCGCLSDICKTLDDEAKLFATKQKYPWIKMDHPFVDGCAVIHCKQCEYDIDHTCSRCDKIVEKFSYSTVCYDCDDDCAPGPGDMSCCCCHRAASEEYEGDYYCDWCI